MELRIPSKHGQLFRRSGGVANSVMHVRTANKPARQPRKTAEIRRFGGPREAEPHESAPLDSLPAGLRWAARSASGTTALPT
jgi:hypothetical protein